MTCNVAIFEAHAGDSLRLVQAGDGTILQVEGLVGGQTVEIRMPAMAFEKLLAAWDDRPACRCSTVRVE